MIRRFPLFKTESMTLRTIISGFLIGCCMQAAGQIQTGVFRTPASNTEYHQFTRVGGGAVVYINQTDASTPILRLSNKTSTANANVVFTVENNGSTGIGTLAPSGKLSVAGGGITLYSDLTNKNDRPVVSSGTLAGEIRGMSSGSPALDDGFLRLSAGGGTSATNKSFIDLSGYTTSGTFDRYNNIILGTRGVERLRVASNGYIGIGTKNPKELLSVNGNVQAKSIIVSTTATDWPDYVFDKEYRLPELMEVAAQIKATGHLPGMPSAASLENEGVDLGKMLKLQQKKIEELTLYLIEQQKQISQLSLLTDQLQNKLSNEKN